LRLEFTSISYNQVLPTPLPPSRDRGLIPDRLSFELADEPYEAALTSSTKALLEIAELNGYQSVSALSTAFNRATGLSPNRLIRTSIFYLLAPANLHSRLGRFAPMLVTPPHCLASPKQTLPQLGRSTITGGKPSFARPMPPSSTAFTPQASPTCAGPRSSGPIIQDSADRCAHW
jgi:hypothetical protein